MLLAALPNTWPQAVTLHGTPRWPGFSGGHDDGRGFPVQCAQAPLGVKGGGGVP